MNYVKKIKVYLDVKLVLNQYINNGIDPDYAEDLLLIEMAKEVKKFGFCIGTEIAHQSAAFSRYNSSSVERECGYFDGMIKQLYANILKVCSESGYFSISKIEKHSKNTFVVILTATAKNVLIDNP